MAPKREREVVKGFKVARVAAQNRHALTRGVGKVRRITNATQSHGAR